MFGHLHKAIQKRKKNLIEYTLLDVVFWLTQIMLQIWRAMWMTEETNHSKCSEGQACSRSQERHENLSHGHRLHRFLSCASNHILIAPVISIKSLESSSPWMLVLYWQKHRREKIVFMVERSFLPRSVQKLSFGESLIFEINYSVVIALPINCVQPWI